MLGAVLLDNGEVAAAQNELDRALSLGACRTWGVEAKFGPSEDSFRRICSSIALAMGQKAGENWTAVAKLQGSVSV